MSGARARGGGAQCADDCGEECGWGGARLRESFRRAGSPPGSPEQTWGQWGKGLANLNAPNMGVCNVAGSGESARARDAAEAEEEERMGEEDSNSVGRAPSEPGSGRWGEGGWWIPRECEREEVVGAVWTEEDEHFHPTKGGLGPWWVEGSQEFPPPESPVGSRHSDTDEVGWWGDSAVAQGRGSEGRGSEGRGSEGRAEEGRGEEGRGEERAAAPDVPAGTGQAPNADPPPPSPRR
jgi:hypothetical protein